MNKVQKTYAIAKAAYEAAAEEEKEFEKKWILDNGIKNPDGSTPESVFCIDTESEEEWDRINEQCAADGGQKLCEEKEELRQLLVKAEDALIDWGLGLPMLPADVRETLNRSRKEYKVRQRLIDLTFRVKA